jgi:hypothetical protein
MNPKRRRRRGATETIGISLDVATKRKLEALAEEKHQGNVSALIAELTEGAVAQAAFEKAWRWYGGLEATADVRAKIDAEMEEGWKLARKHAGRKPKRSAALLVDHVEQRVDVAVARKGS